MILRSVAAALGVAACLVVAAPASLAGAPEASPANASSIAPAASVTPAVTPAAARGVARLGGANRFDTAVRISQDTFTGPTGTAPAGAVVLARGDSYADSLSAAPLAVAASGPLLLTPSGTLHPSVAAEVRRLLPAGRTVYLLGGTSAVGSGVEQRLAADGYRTVRLQGPNRYATAVRVAEELERLTGRTPGWITLTTGTDFPDGLAAGAGSALYSEPVLLTQGATLPPETRAYLAARSSVPVVAFGGAAASSGTYTEELAGRDRYETAELVAAWFFSHADEPRGAGAVVGVATGLDWPDALPAGVHAVRSGGPLLLSRPDALPSATVDAVRMLANRRAAAAHVKGFVYGGDTVVRPGVSSELTSLLGR